VQDDPAELMTVLAEFAAIRDPARARSVLERHPALLGATAEAALDYQLGILREAGGDPGLVALVAERRTLLRRCRELGIAAAFAEAERESAAGPSAGVRELGEAIMRFVRAESWTASRRVLDAHPMLLTERADAAMDAMIEGARHARAEDAVQILRRHQQILRRCVLIGVAATFAELQEPAQDEDPPLTDLVRLFVRAPSRSAAEHLLGRWPQLVCEDAVALVAAVADVADREGALAVRDVVRARQAVLQRAGR
jgi:hypothetical protein